MLFISSRLHGIFDYLLAMTLVMAPWVLDMSDNLAPALVSVGIGWFVLMVALVTDYELSAIRIIPLSLHVSLDVILGLFLISSPWLLDFENAPHGLHMMAGLALIAVAAFTVRVPKNVRAKTQYIQWV